MLSRTVLHSFKNLVVVYVATWAVVPCLNLSFSCKMMRSWYFSTAPHFFVCWICLDHSDARANSFSSIARHQKSSQPGHDGGRNTFQAITQLPTGFLPNAMYFLKAHGAPDTHNSLFGAALHLINDYLEVRRNFVTRRVTTRESSSQTLLTLLFSTKCICFLNAFSCPSPFFSWLLYLKGELAFFVLFCLFYLLDRFSFFGFIFEAF